jgi:hypothetical protein
MAVAARLLPRILTMEPRTTMAAPDGALVDAALVIAETSGTPLCATNPGESARSQTDKVVHLEVE